MSLNFPSNSKQLCSLSSFIKSLKSWELKGVWNWIFGRSPRRCEVDPLGAWCPHTPFEKQKLFLRQTCREAFFGGAAGGG